MIHKLPAMAGAAPARLANRDGQRSEQDQHERAFLAAACRGDALGRKLELVLARRRADHRFASLNRRAMRYVKMFNASVMTNSIDPSAKMVRYTTLPVGVSPSDTCTM